MEHTSPRRVRARRLPHRVSADCRETCCQAANADPRAASAKTQPAPSSTRGNPSRMPGNRTPRTAESAQVPTAITATSLSCASIRSAACRRSSARRSSSARRRSASIWARSISNLALSRSKTSLRAATSTPVRPASICPGPGVPGGLLVRPSTAPRPMRRAALTRVPAVSIAAAHSRMPIGSA